ncbi:hypothetical protein C8Q79DRAFT_161111 [Trametes meyenii]|nr:hypothetical protein C8Q79DRAFT_161111 [Trametes meyenii]
MIAPREHSPTERANRISECIGVAMLLRWQHEGKQERKRTRDIIFMYSCCQSTAREKKPKVPKGEKARDTRRMQRFECDGWLHITVSPASDIVEVTLKHFEAHLPYDDIDLPDEWKRYIEKQGLTQTPGTIWEHIVQVEDQRRAVDPEHPLFKFKQKSVYYHWLVVTRNEWRLAPTPLASAEKFLELKGA